ncbi:MAG: glutamate--tRNA ligase, partial [Desulfobacterales bacterium]|nr:glutamate--tRNA ligase [Desulfobacterales bacterium]
IAYDEKAAGKFLKPDALNLMSGIRDRIESLSDFTQKTLEEVFLAFMEKEQIKLGKIAQPLRVALTGTSVSPGLFEVMEVLGKKEVLTRIDKALAHMARKTS